VGHDLLACRPETVQTGQNGPNTTGGPVAIGRDLTIRGSARLRYAFGSTCDLTVGHPVWSPATTRPVTETRPTSAQVGTQCAGTTPVRRSKKMPWCRVNPAGYRLWNGSK
jgi:hypothetical protein